MSVPNSQMARAATQPRCGVAVVDILSMEPQRWSGSIRNWSVIGAVSLNPGKVQEIEFNNRLLKRSYLDNWVEDYRSVR